MGFKNMSPSKLVFRIEINNKHTPALLCITASFTDWVQKYPGIEFSWTILAGIE